MQKKLLFLGADSSTADAVRYARAKGVYTIVTDYNPPEKVEAKQLADAYWMISVAEIGELETKCREEQISGVFAGSQEFCLDCCKELCQRLRLPFYASDAGWRVSRNKLLYKQVCREFGLKTPALYSLDSELRPEDLERIRYPLIVKPADSFAQQGLSLVRCEKELKPAFDLAMSFSPGRTVLAEEYIAGDEVFIFCYIHDGIVTLLGIGEDLTAEDVNGRANYGLCIHRSRYLGQIREAMIPRFQTMTRSLGCRDGTCIFQGIFREKEYYNLEFCYRLDGIRSWRHLSRVCGVNQLELMVDLSLGTKPDDAFWAHVIPEEARPLSIGYVIWGKPGRVDRVVGRSQLHAREDVTILLEHYPTGSEILPNDNMRSIVYDLTLYGNNYEELSRTVSEINGFLHHYDPQGKDLLIYQELSYRGQ